MATKYIVDNLTGQTITGNLTINGNITVTGTSNNSGVCVYRALLTQTGQIIGYNISNFNYGLIVGETYTVTDYQGSDDFSNIADIQSGGIFNFDYVWTNPGYVSFNGVTGTTSGLGSGASFNGYWCGTTVNSVTINIIGVGYAIGDTITIPGADVGGSTPENNITITLTNLTPNVTGSIFIATGETPSYWDNGSELTSGGGLIVDVLENTLGYGLYWEWAPFGGGGYYIAVNDATGPIYNSFQKNNLEIITPLKYPFNGGGYPPFIIPYINSEFIKDGFIVVDVINTGGPPELSNDLLYYTPIEIKINQDTDITPIQTYGLNVSNFPYGNLSIDIFAGDNNVQTIYGNYNLVNNINELVAALNTDSELNFLGTYSVNEGVENGIILTMPTNLKNQFSPNNTLTFEIFND